MILTGRLSPRASPARRFGARDRSTSASPLPPPEEFDVRNTAARNLRASAAMFSLLYVDKKRKFVLLWRHPDSPADDYQLLCYESQMSCAPDCVIGVPSRGTRVEARPAGENYRFCLALGVPGESHLLVADDEATIGGWVSALQNCLARPSATNNEDDLGGADHNVDRQEQVTPGRSASASARDGEARPEQNSASHSLRRARLMSQVNPGSHYRCGKRT